MTSSQVFLTLLVSSTSLTIVEPIDGEIYDGDWLPLRAIVENEDEPPDSVHFSLNDGPVVLISRLNTDWYTYMRDNNRNGSSPSPAPLDATVLWTAPVTGTYHEFISPIVVDGRVYHASEDQETAFCLDAGTGEILWSFEGLGDPIDDALAYADGFVYVASDSVWCLNAMTGERVWAYLWRGDCSMVGPPVVSDGVLFAVESKPNTCFVSALDAASGELEWVSYLPHQCASTPTASQSLVLVPTFFGPLYALEQDTGDIAWTNTDDAGYWDTSPIIVGSTVFIGGYDAVHSIQIGNGIQNWETAIGGRVECTPAYADGKLYVGSAFPEATKCIASLDAATGEILWTGEGGLHASMAVSDGYLFWGDTWDGTINCTDASNGNPVWSYQTESSICGIVSSPCVVDGVMYIAATDSYLYAFGTGLKYTYRDDYFYADVGDNELIVTSFNDDVAVAADTINFTVTGTGITVVPPARLSLRACPNPFTSSSVISFDLAAPGIATVRVFDLSGRAVGTLIETELCEGEQTVTLDGRGWASGVYLIRLSSDVQAETARVVLVR